MLKNTALALATSILLYLGWPEGGFAPLLFIGFIPLLFVEHFLASNDRRRKGLKFFGYSFLSFAVWNLLSLWWLANAHWIAMLAAVLLNSVLMSTAMVTFHFIKRKIGAKRGYIALPFLWISMESLQHHWDLAFPWLTLGNGFAVNVEWVQWYEHVGIFGGSLWILLINLILFRITRSYFQNKKLTPALWKGGAVILLGIGLPILLSYIRYSNYENKGAPAEVVVVQHNIDTYKEKFSLSQEEQLEKFIRLARKELDDSVDFLVGPESMLSKGIFEDQLSAHPAIQELQQLSRDYGDLSIVVGAMTFQRYEDDYTQTARALEDSGYYDAYNSALLISGDKPIEIYHKSKLVAGVEQMPFHEWLSPYLGDVSADMGGTTGTLGTQAEREVFVTDNGKFKIAPLICWESDFGEYVTEFVRNGANLVFIITNDDWWGETQGHVQHMHYARLRAIENRRSIARSANTGISCFINQRGDLLRPQAYRKDSVIRASIQANEELTYYSKAGDLLSRLSYFIGGFLFLYALVYGYLRRKESMAR